MMHPRTTSWFDLIVNVLLFVPIGYCWFGLLARERKGLAAIMAAVATVAGCLALSIGIEFIQLWLPVRYCSRSDIAMQFFGTLLGIGGWIFCGANISLSQRAEAE